MPQTSREGAAKREVAQETGKTVLGDEALIGRPDQTAPAPAALPAPLPLREIFHPRECPNDARTAALENAACPECGGTLSKSTGWCPKCGYCGFLKAGRKPDIQETTPGIAGLFKTAMESEWLPLLACGLVIIVLGSFTAALNVRGEAMPRFIWCVSQVSLGALAFTLGYGWAFLKIVPVGQRREQLPMLAAQALWIAVWQGLPGTRWPFCLAVWGGCCGIAALFIYVL